MRPGIAQLGPVSIVDWGCNSRSYWIGIPQFSRGPVASTATDCSTQFEAYDAEPIDFSVAPMVFGVGQDLPPTVAPEAPSKVLAHMEGTNLIFTWPGMKPPQLSVTQFPDWAYYAKWDGQVRDFTNYRYPSTLGYVAFIDVDGLSGTHKLRLRTFNRFGLSEASEQLTIDLAVPLPIRDLTVVGNLKHNTLSWRQSAGGQTH